MHRPRVPLVLLLAALVLSSVMAGFSSAAEARTPTSAPHAASVDDPVLRSGDDAEDLLLNRINEVRAAQGLRKIWHYDACTDGLAEQWGDRIAGTGVFEHRDQNEVITRCHMSWAGEMLVRGTDLTPDAMVELWMNSPSHRDILLSPRARRAGIAITADSTGRVIGVVDLVRLASAPGARAHRQ